MPRIKQSEPTTLEEALNTGQGAGYVLDFVDRTPALINLPPWNTQLWARIW